MNEVVDLLDRMAEKGLAFSQTLPDGKKVYMLLPMFPGVFEYPIMGHRHLKVDYDRLIPLWNRYFDRGLGRELHASKTNMSRIVPIRQSIDPKSQVMTYDELEPYIEKAELISVGDCPCRVIARKCKSPIETCISFDGAARFLVERKLNRLISKEETYRILKECEDAGLVHMPGNTAEKLLVLCNCCSCCCTGLGAITRFKDAVSRPVAAFCAEVNTEECMACGLCEEKCPMKAIAVDQDKGAAVVNRDLCIGCGLCYSACPSESVHLMRREDVPPPPARAKDLGIAMAQEKGRLKEFLDNLK